MKIIYKQILPQRRQNEYGSLPILLPEDAIVLKVSERFGIIFIWFLTDSSNKSEKKDRVFEIVPTGMAFNDEFLKYIDTLFQEQFVWHLFERIIP